MRNVVLTLMISASAAVRAGTAAFGAYKLELSDEDIEALTDEQRDTLARHLERLHPQETALPRVEGEVRWQDFLTSHAKPISHVTSSTLADLLDQRRAKMRAQHRGDEP